MGKIKTVLDNFKAAESALIQFRRELCEALRFVTNESQQEELFTLLRMNVKQCAVTEKIIMRMIVKPEASEK